MRFFLSIPPPAPLELEPEEVRFTVLYEDEALVVVDKPPGLVVHPAPGHRRGTLVHGLLRHCQGLSGIGGMLRPGIVHRLDKDTSGLLVVAKSDQAHASLADQLKAGSMRKEYLALVHGLMKGTSGEIALPIGRHPRNRKKMAVRDPGGKPALTRWQVMEAFRRGCSLLEVVIQTGRTHQIRVHLGHIGHPVVGDPVYGHGRNCWKALDLPGLAGAVERQLLHARRLGFLHPLTQRRVAFEAPVPEDMQRACEALKAP